MKKPFIIYPFLFAAYSVLGVYASNGAEVHIRWVVRPLAAVILFSIVIYFVAYIFAKNNLRAGWISTLVLLWLFYGHIDRFLYKIGGFASHPWRSVLLLGIWSALILFLGSKQIWQNINEQKRVANYLNFIAIVLIVYPASMTVSYWRQIREQTAVMKNYREKLISVQLDPVSPAPDIYLIVLDAYGRADYLEAVFGYKNTEFTDFLTQKGFYIATQSSSNYPQTQLSLNSLLNMVYLHDLTHGLEESSNRAPLYEMFQTNDVIKSLEETGYKTIGLPSVVLFSRLKSADVYYPMTSIELTSFEELILSTTVADHFFQTGDLDAYTPSYDTHRDYITFELDKLKDIPAIPGPKFVFAHLMAPHPPFVFDQEGNPVQPDYAYTLADAGVFPGTREEYITGYKNELTYLNHALTDVISTILEKSQLPPIIIIQGDHGPGAYFTNTGLPGEACLWERYAILNAYYFPEQQYDLLYPTITPVNTFRIVFNTYFGTDLAILPDKSYYATWNKPYHYTDITGEIPAACDPLPER